MKRLLALMLCAVSLGVGAQNRYLNEVFTEVDVTTNVEWMTMEMALGMSLAEVNNTGFRGTDQGSQMKTDFGWPLGENGTNSSGFSGLPSGYRAGGSCGCIIQQGLDGVWWSSSGNSSSQWSRKLNFTVESVGRNSSVVPAGLSVRCIKDTE